MSDSAYESSRDSIGPRGDSGRRLLVVGAGGHAKVVIEVARAAGWTPIAAVDPHRKGDVLGVPVQGTDDDIAALWASGTIDSVVIAIGDNRLRQTLATRARALGCQTASLVHPAAQLSPTARTGEGVVVMAGAIVNADVTIGHDCIVNTGAVVEHDCVLADGVHAAPRSVMGGSCRIGRATLFGIGATARPGTTIGAYAIVAAGAVVVSDVPDHAEVAGVPARPLRRTGPIAGPGGSRPRS